MLYAFKYFYLIFLIIYPINYALAYTIQLKKIEISKLQSKIFSNIKVYEMSSDFEKFGGISGLKILSEKKNPTYPSNFYDFYFLSDEGFYFNAKPQFDNDNNLKSFSIKNIIPLKSTDNISVMGNKIDGDAEAIDIVADEVFVAFERNHRVLKYSASKIPEHYINPENFKNLSFNEGIEAMGFIKDQLILITEDSKASPLTTFAYLYDKNKLKTFYYPLHKDFKPTDLTVINDEEILVLERSYTPNFGNRARLLSFKFSDVKEGEIIKLKQLLKLKPPFPLDNYEAIGNIRLAENMYKLFIVSDDNYNSRQKNLLIELNYKKQN
jgi:hypothetical protein